MDLLRNVRFLSVHVLNQHDCAEETRERFWKKIQLNGSERQKLARKKFLAVSVACMAIY